MKQQIQRIFRGDLLAVEATVGVVNLASGLGLCLRVLLKTPDATFSALALTCASLVQVAAVLEGSLKFRYRGLLAMMAACVAQVLLSVLGNSLVGIMHYSVMALICIGLALRASVIDMEIQRIES